MYRIVLAVFLFAMAFGIEARAQAILATVNDHPITNFDVQQRINLLKFLGGGDIGGDVRKTILKSLVDEQVKLDAAVKYKMAATPQEIDKQIATMAKSANVAPKSYPDYLRKKGVDQEGLRRFVATQIGFSRLLASKHTIDTNVSETEVQKKIGQIKQDINQRIDEVMKDPRMKPVTVYEIMEIELPVEVVDGNIDNQLLEARAIEAAQLSQKINGCKNIKSATAGTFNVKVGKMIEADGTKVPPPLRQALDKVGVGKVIGPARSASGVQLIAFCGTRKIEPPRPNAALPSSEQVRTAIANEKYGSVEERYLKELRKSAYIEYKAR